MPAAHHRRQLARCLREPPASPTANMLAGRPTAPPVRPKPGARQGNGQQGDTARKPQVGHNDQLRGRPAGPTAETGRRRALVPQTGTVAALRRLLAPRARWLQLAQRVARRRPTQGGRPARTVAAKLQGRAQRYAANDRRRPAQSAQPAVASPLVDVCLLPRAQPLGRHRCPQPTARECLSPCA